MVNKQEKDGFFEQLEETGRKIAEEKQNRLAKKRQSFLKLIKGRDKWKIRVSLSATDILIISRVLCRSLSLNGVLQKQSYAIFSCEEEEKLVSDVLHKLLLSFRMSSSHREDMITHPNYTDKKWHGTGLDIIFKSDISYKFVDAQRLQDDHNYEMIGPEQYRKNVKIVLEEMTKKELILDKLLMYPDASINEIAALTGSTSQYVYKVRKGNKNTP